MAAKKNIAVYVEPTQTSSVCWYHYTGDQLDAR